VGTALLVEFTGQLTLGGVPDLDLLLDAAAEERLAVGRERESGGELLVPVTEGAQLLAGGDVPDVNLLVGGGDGQSLAVVGQSNLEEAVGILPADGPTARPTRILGKILERLAEMPQLLAGGSVPNVEDAVFGGADDLLAAVDVADELDRPAVP